MQFHEFLAKPAPFISSDIPRKASDILFGAGISDFLNSHLLSVHISILCRLLYINRRKKKIEKLLYSETSNFKKGKKVGAAKNIVTTFLVFVVFVILLIVINFVKTSGFSGDVTIDNTIIFLAILPFIIYLAVSGKISEFKGGGLEVKFNNASNAGVSFKSEEVVFDEVEAVVKVSVKMLRKNILPNMAKKLTSVLFLVPGEGWYKYEALKEYLEELTKFDFFKYVVFVGNDRETFKGYIHARDILAQLLDEFKKDEIFNRINSGDVEGILGFKNNSIRDNISNRDALKNMEKGITEAAVVDENGKFKGFTNQDIITTKIVNNLMTKTG